MKDEWWKWRWWKWSGVGGWVDGGGDGEGHLLVIFCGRHKWVTLKAIIKKANVWNRNASDIPETLIIRNTET